MGSASVVVSPRARPSAMSRSSLRMIFPERVFGRSAENKMSSGRASAPIFFATNSRSSTLSAGLCLFLSRSVTKATIACPFSSWDFPATAASAPAVPALVIVIRGSGQLTCLRSSGHLWDQGAGPCSRIGEGGILDIRGIERSATRAR